MREGSPLRLVAKLASRFVPPLAGLTARSRATLRREHVAPAFEGVTTRRPPQARPTEIRPPGLLDSHRGAIVHRLSVSRSACRLLPRTQAIPLFNTSITSNACWPDKHCRMSYARCWTDNRTLAPIMLAVTRRPRIQKANRLLTKRHASASPLATSRAFGLADSGPLRWSSNSPSAPTPQLWQAPPMTVFEMPLAAKGRSRSIAMALAQIIEPRGRAS